MFKWLTCIRCHINNDCLDTMKIIRTYPVAEVVTLTVFLFSNRKSKIAENSQIDGCSVKWLMTFFFFCPRKCTK